jgi:hypothetical protein
MYRAGHVARLDSTAYRSDIVRLARNSFVPDPMASVPVGEPWRYEVV